MKHIAYENEAAGLQIWHDSEDPKEIQQSWAERQSVALQLPGFPLSSKAGHIAGELVRQMLDDAIREKGGVPFGDIEIIREGGDQHGADGLLVASSKFWPLVPGSEREEEMRGGVKLRSVNIQPGAIVVQGGDVPPGGGWIAPGEDPIHQSYLIDPTTEAMPGVGAFMRPAPRAVRDEPQA